MSAASDHAGKWDRAARYLKIAMILRDHPEGISADDVAGRIGVSKRTIYRDIQAMDLDAGLPIW
ncbi:MAG: HTH domain-containing protein, partial [Chloroflexota bacterium]